MKCQHCHEHEAVNTFLIAYPGGQQEIHLCERCTRMAQQAYMMARQAGQNLPGSLDEAQTRQVGAIPFPDTAAPAILHRRKLNMLRARLDFAVREEHYEEAARLRDEIAAQEREVPVS